MKRLILLPATLGILAGIFGTSWAHVPEGVIYHACRIPDDRLPTIDGDLSDWEWMPRAYVWTLEEWPFRSYGDTRKDFDVVLYIGWSPSQNMLYQALKVTDDEIYTPEPDIQKSWREDHFQWYEDADHSGGNYRGEEDSQQAQQWLYTPQEDRIGIFGPMDKFAWALKPPYAFVASKVTSEGYTLEMAKAIWDHLDPAGPDSSIRHMMKPGETIGWKALVVDYDSKGGRAGASFNNVDAWQDASMFADLHLDTGGPRVNKASVRPKYPAAGDTVTITADVWDEDGISSVVARIKRPDGKVIATVELYDDGEHRDGAPGDSTYGNCWRTPAGSSELDTFYVDISTVDDLSNEDTYNNICQFFTTISFKKMEWSMEYQVESKPEYVLHAEKDTVWMSYGDYIIQRTLSAMNDTEDINIFYRKVYNGKPKPFILYSEEDTVEIHYSEKPIGVILCSKQDTVYARIHYIGEREEAHYTEEYIEENKGKVIVEIPEVYELANIAIAITDYGLRNPYRVFKEGEYYKRVLEHFLPFKNHPLISKLDIEFSDEELSNYFSFRENSSCYVFRGDSIVNAGIYSNVRVPNLFRRYMKLAEDFAKVSQFRKFYRDNLPYYREQIREYKKKVPVRKMWSWLEKNFPNRYDCYKIIFSPLITGSHSTARFEDKGFKEIVMFVAGPELYKKKYSGEIEEALLSRIVFTEIDHNYVNPITDRYLDRVNEIFSDIGKWNKQSSYRSPYATFNEYMTWAVFNLYAYDTYDKETFEAINRMTVDSMVERRRFVLFKEFNEKLLQLYLNRKEGETIPDLYPKILAWAEKM